ncbi:MAG: serine/threonine protein kinase, partial [Acidobacteriales bacterium]|nr:serine/threonine protein kinase [Terriglobales bacterium]
SDDADSMERFRNEVRTARKVSHPNVCRVYDVGEVDGQIFLSMEYIDGEDLASLLRRIGRLPSDKGIEIARQLCAGLAAAHREGVLHRDLKPANVMLDGRGRAVITDFGLANVAEQIHGHDVRSGTPAYMSPEQLAGKEVTARSDIYSLGLVLYEIFTGKRPYEAENLAEMTRLQKAYHISATSSWVKDLDPAVERVIIRCLEPDPAKRPDSALMVSAALPGGDPLAAALAAGETPSPQMVAAAGEHAGLSPRSAILSLIGVLIGLVLVAGFGARENGLQWMKLENPPEVLTSKAREVISRLGYSPQATDCAAGFSYDDDFLEYLERREVPRPNWKEALGGSYPLLQYWYRQSPENMQPTDVSSVTLTPGIVSFVDPPNITSGMLRLLLSPQGHLLYFEAIPPEVDPHPEAAGTPDWNGLLSAAGLDPTQLAPAEPQWNSLAASDARKAWTGVWPGSKRPLRVEAAAYYGKPVFFSAMGPWTAPDRVHNDTRTPRERAAGIIETGLGILLMFCATWLAYHNHRKGRGDRESAWKNCGSGAGNGGRRLDLPRPSATHDGYAGAVFHGA